MTLSELSSYSAIIITLLGNGIKILAGFEKMYKILKRWFSTSKEQENQYDLNKNARKQFEIKLEEFYQKMEIYSSNPPNFKKYWETVTYLVDDTFDELTKACRIAEKLSRKDRKEFDEYLKNFFIRTFPAIKNQSGYRFAKSDFIAQKNYTKSLMINKKDKNIILEMIDTLA